MFLGNVFDMNSTNITNKTAVITIGTRWIILESVIWFAMFFDKRPMEKQNNTHRLQLPSALMLGIKAEISLLKRIKEMRKAIP